jgi:processive 1,2-diacylglycerol beta-glucosyltransferase
MPYLYNQTTGILLGEISDEALQFLVDQLEEESLEDKDYSITRMELTYFESQGANPQLLEMLRGALGDHDEVIVQWSRQKRA